MVTESTLFRWLLLALLCWSSLLSANQLVLLAETEQQEPAPMETEAHQATPISTELEDSLQLLLDLQEGLILTLAACVDEPHCVTALNEEEMNRMQEELETLLAQQEPDDHEGHELQARFQALKTGYTELQQAFLEVSTRIDRDNLQGNWADQFVFDDFVIGPTVPFPNEHLLLSRFEDLNQPLPIE
ncbi:hypothetical protein [Marinospirillum alkaliphilum]|uniref:Uncharacterized protein n=1 Tax=Marinospirillum alkaliphilum DSM 21637 TaxID=1122209 RepID=A0A1K1Z9M7_9GAMM|nr:hypothetical protein [Marinospirillum alkaliphilum]SFX70799.1 hypothetical protein SAMN02745752_02610 [Marinospirillum alkaliphilum DSM 21637]